MQPGFRNRLNSSLLRKTCLFGQRAISAEDSRREQRFCTNSVSRDGKDGQAGWPIARVFPIARTERMPLRLTCDWLAAVSRSWLTPGQRIGPALSWLAGNSDGLQP